MKSHEPWSFILRICYIIVNDKIVDMFSTYAVSVFQHHCRNCGDIFCNECSDNKMPLPSSAKPVRVCDNCHTVLLQRYSAN